MSHHPPPRYPPKPKAVYFFGTCLLDVFHGRAGLAAVELIEREGVRVIYPQDQTCCGQPPFNSGYRDESRHVAEAQMALMPGPHPVVVPSGSCGAMMRVHYPRLFAGDPMREPASREFASRVFEWSEFMVNVLGVTLVDRGQPAKVTYHPSCHLMRELHAGDAPLALLRQLGNVELLPLPQAEECCGFGGTFSVKYDAISAAMVGDKAGNIADTGAHTVVSADAGCLMNIGGALARRGHPIAVKPLAAFLKERVDGT
jgi:L-lactate dehydrogenase complex protein LldE